VTGALTGTDRRATSIPPPFTKEGAGSGYSAAHRVRPAPQGSILPWRSPALSPITRVSLGTPSSVLAPIIGFQNYVVDYTITHGVKIPNRFT